MSRTYQAKVLTVSDSVDAGTREDVSGAAVVVRLESEDFEVIEHRVVSDELDEVVNALSYMAYGFNGLIVTTGGTGFGPRDLTPEATRRILDRTAPGMGEAMRNCSPLGRLSRAIAGTRGSAQWCARQTARCSRVRPVSRARSTPRWSPSRPPGPQRGAPPWS